MKYNIWRFLSHILSYRTELNEIIKPFMENLNNDKINTEKHLPFLLTFTKYKLEILQKYGIINTELYNYLHSRKMPLKSPQNSHDDQSPNNVEEIIKIEGIIDGDKIKELQEILLEKDIKTFQTIRKSFREVEEMKIPLIQYSIMKNAIKCFKYLLVNGYDDPNKTMNEKNLKSHRYLWDCMATAIYFGKKDVIKILEDKEMEKGKKLAHIVAAILSYRNEVVDEIFDALNEENNAFLSKGILAASKSNNIKVMKILLEKGVDINGHDAIFISIKKTEHHFIMQE